MLRVLVYELMLPAVQRGVYEKALEGGEGGIVVVITALGGPERGGPWERVLECYRIGMVSGVYSISRSYR